MLGRASRLLLSGVNLGTKELGCLPKRCDWNHNKMLVLDYNDLIKIPIINDYIRDSNRDAIKIRDKTSGEVANQNLFFPGLLPKIPDRFYYLFGKPVRTKGKEKMLEDKHNANQLYLQIKSQVQNNINYLIKKREEDPYRNIVDRIMYRATYSSDTPAFEP